jgi:nitroreductase
MDFKEVLNKRYSVRSFKSKLVEIDKIEAILEAGQSAPTAGNKQLQRVVRIVVACQPNILKKFDLCSPCRFGAPLVFIVCYDKTVCWMSSFNTDNSGHIDTSIANTYMMLTAESLGLSTLWVLRFDPAKVSEQFRLPENIIPVSSLVVGYPAKDAAPSERHFQRFPKEQMILA